VILFWRIVVAPSRTGLDRRFDNIDLIDLATKAKANRKDVSKSQSMAAMLHDSLAPIFGPPPKRRRVKHSGTMP
jgi:hypothetical protein